MFIKISGLSDGIHKFDYTGKIGEIGLQTPFYGIYEIKSELTKSRNQFVLESEVNVPVEFECDRCGTNYKSEINTNFRMVYILTPEVKESDDPNIEYLPLDTDKIDISKDIFDFTNLAVPMKKLCTEECKGLCAGCGADLNNEICRCSTEKVDERWLPLMELKNKLNN